MRRFFHNLGELLEMIKFGHSVLALPFAFMGAVLAARGLPDGRTLFFIIVAMVGARSAAMAFNRLADARIDAANPRTADRALPAGKISRRATLLFIGVSAVLFMGAASQLNRICFALSPVALLVILGYSLTKRFTIGSHMVLGLSLGLAPVGGWLAVRGDLGLSPGSSLPPGGSPGVCRHWPAGRFRSHLCRGRGGKCPHTPGAAPTAVRPGTDPAASCLLYPQRFGGLRPGIGHLDQPGGLKQRFFFTTLQIFSLTMIFLATYNGVALNGGIRPGLGQRGRRGLGY